MVVVFEDKWEGEVVEGDGVTVHMGKYGKGEGGRVGCHVSDDGVV